MITIKRSCNSSVRDDPVNHKITYGAFTITIEEGSYDLLRSMMDEIKINAVEALRFAIYEGLDVMLPEQDEYTPFEGAADESKADTVDE